MLDESQKRAAYHKSRKLLITAPAGSGKTRVLIERVKWLVTRQHDDAKHILVLTFAHKAAAEIRERLAEQGLKEVTAQTFHAWAFRLAKRIHTAPFRMITEEQRALLLRRLLNQILKNQKIRIKTDRSLDTLNWSRTYLAQELIMMIQTLRQFGWTYEAASLEIKNKQIVWEFTNLMLQLWQLYESLLERHSAFDFSLLIRKAEDQLRADPRLLVRIRSKLEYLLVDEMQDSNQQELRLLEMIRKPSCGITFVGDLNQAIYAWRGTSHFKWNSDQVVLQRNYRSDLNIIRNVNSFLGLNILAQHKATHLPVVIKHKRYEELEVLEKLIPELLVKGYKQSDVLVLARAHNPLQNIKKIKDRYKRLKLGTVHSVKGLEAPVVILLNCSEDRFGFPLPLREVKQPLLKELANYDQAGEERRLFYVAMTRAKERLIIMSDQKRPSVFLNQLDQRVLKNVTM